jgi:hypothetical protein
MPDLDDAYSIWSHLSSGPYREIVRDRIDWLRLVRDNWDNRDIVTKEMVKEFIELFGIRGCIVTVDDSVFAKNEINAYHPVFIVIPVTPTGSCIDVEMDIDNVDCDSWVSVPFG